jgi:hypothetical protein
MIGKTPEKTMVKILAQTAVLAGLSLGTRPLAALGAAAAPPAAGPSELQADGPRKAYEAGRRAASKDEKRRHFTAGIQQARSRLAARPDDPDGLLWLAANLGADALVRGKLNALRVLPEMERLLLRLEEVAPEHEHAAAARTLGRLYHKAPPVISIGSDAKARVWFERALARAPGFPGNQALAADFFDDQGDDARARALARAVLSGPAAREVSPDAEEWREIATRILED